MDKNFVLISEEREGKNRENGYFETLAKRGGGVVLIVLGVIVALVALPIGYMAFSFTMDLIRGESSDTGFTIFAWLLTLAFFVPGVLLIRFGFKRKGMNAEDWIKKSVQASDYSESVIRDFGMQAVSPGSIHFNLAGLSSVPGGVLTKDYISSANLLKLCVIKRSDISGAYLVSLPDTVNVGNKIKTVHTMNVAVFSNHKTYIVMSAKEKYGERLIAMLTEQHPNIDTANGRVLSDKEYDELVSATR